MTIARVNPGTWLSGNKITQTQINLLDTNFQLAVDGRVGALEIATRTLTRIYFNVGSPVNPASWNQIYPGFATVTAATAQSFTVPLLLPHGCTLTDFHQSFQGALGHVGVLPPTKPTVKIFKQLFGAGGATQIGATATDAPATAAAFEAIHVLGPSGGAGPSLTGLSEVIDNSLYGYYVSVTTEGGGGSAVAGDIVGPMKVVFTISKLDEG